MLKEGGHSPQQSPSPPLHNPVFSCFCFWDFWTPSDVALIRHFAFPGWSTDSHLFIMSKLPRWPRGRHSVCGTRLWKFEFFPQPTEEAESRLPRSRGPGPTPTPPGATAYPHPAPRSSARRTSPPARPPPPARVEVALSLRTSDISRSHGYPHTHTHTHAPSRTRTRPSCARLASEGGDKLTPGEAARPGRRGEAGPGLRVGSGRAGVKVGPRRPAGLPPLTARPPPAHVPGDRPPIGSIPATGSE